MNNMDLVTIIVGQILQLDNSLLLYNVTIHERRAFSIQTFSNIKCLGSLKFHRRQQIC